MDIELSNKIGSRISLLICLPPGLVFSFCVFMISLFPPFDIALMFGGGGLFWFPGSIIIPLTFVYLLWKGGRKIVKSLNRNRSILRTSFSFSLYVNSNLFLIIAIIWAISAIFF